MVKLRVCIALLVFACQSMLFGQANTGTILGRVTDASGAAVPNVKVTTTGEQAGGAPINASYTAKYDGSESPVNGAPYDTISIKQVNANTFAYNQKKKDGKYNVAGRSAISKDGKTMTNNFKGTTADGKPYLATMVWEKQ